jgi:16S rRNA (adenine1518-N6/adenine1519-N6)-dimethyltransferase
MSLYRHTRELLQSAGLRPRKRLGQNFLVDASALDAIIEAARLSPEDVVLEVGAGTGTLTQRLALLCGGVIAVEVDEGLFRILQSTCQGKSSVTLIHADILDLDFSALMDVGAMHASPVQAAQPLRIKVIGNLPYYITTPILMKVLEASSLLPIQMVLVMVQEEVGKRIVASPGTKDYGALSIAIAYHSDAEILRRVPANSFYPQPRVDSVLVRLNMRSAPSVDIKDERLFFQIVRAAFQYRRKTLRNALRLASRSGEMQFSASCIDSALQALGFDPRRRGETLSCAEFADLANMVMGNG